jgi:succinate-semialdehyde dehydrogenase / glutarate-semialdehyde dehydrogenase
MLNTLVRESAAAAIESVPRQLLIGGRWQDSRSRATSEVVNPATGQMLCAVADAAPEDGMRALDRAVGAQRAFAAMPPRARADILMNAFHLMRERAERLALIITLEMGKPLAESRGEVAYAAEFFRHFAEEATRIAGGYQVAPDGRTRFLIMKQPVGPSLLITPWNFPLAMGTRKLGPAIAAGCTSVVKPAPQTPLSMLALGQILGEAGVPDGAVNIVTTTDAAAVSAPMIASGRARKLSFTGSTAVGRHLLGQCAQQVMRTSMELGGNAAFLVFADADLDKAVEGVLAAKMRNGGEACTAANRIYVQAGVAGEFSERLAAAMAALPIGDGLDEGIRLGPLINEAAREKVHGLVAEACVRGARLLTGGEPIDRPGYFYPPTVLADVPASARLMREEIFGPVAPVVVFDTEDEAVAAANDTEYGLVSYIFTRDLDRALRVAEAIETGMVGVNQGVVSNPAAPFGGVKASGLGREGGNIGIDEFLEVKYVGVAVS